MKGGNAILTSVGNTNTWTIAWTSASQDWLGNVIVNTKGGLGRDSSGWTGIPKVSGGTWTTATAQNDYLTQISGTKLDNVFSSNGLLKRTGAATYTVDTNTYSIA